MKNLKLILVVAIVAGFVSVNSGCSKSNNNSGSSSSKDSVLYSPWMSLTATFNNTDSAYEDNIAASHVTQAIVDHGAVLSYYKNGLGEISLAGDLGLLSFVSAGNILLLAGGDFTSTSFSDPLVYRYVIIPGSVAVTSSANGVVSGSGRSYSVDQLKSMSYSQVIKALNIPADGGTIK